MTDAERVPMPWNATTSKYKQPDLLKSWWQISNTLIPFFGLWYVMYLSYSYSYLLTLFLAIPTAGLLVRVFIIQHDCGHHSFFKNHRSNDLLGSFCGFLTLTPYHFWRRTHARHHVTSGNLDHRGHGDVGVLTVREYQQRSLWGQWRYRIYRNPLFMFFLGASFLFIVQQRFTTGAPRSWRRERMSVYTTNLAIAATLTIAWFTIGLQTFLMIELPIVVLGAAAGSWLFFVQHQYEEAYWEHNKSWDFTTSALKGSSYYRLPSVLRWFSGNIGYHHIHHLNSRIPNYNLPACYDEELSLRQAPTFGLRESLHCAALKLWDEDQQQMVTFRETKRLVTSSTLIHTDNTSQSSQPPTMRKAS
ncbi:MAG: fatty acid desaturase [Pirellulaceae bacterium]|nr:fatty acid desaturase [Pirellulaceae bacterium]